MTLSARTCEDIRVLKVGVFWSIAIFVSFTAYDMVSDFSMMVDLVLHK